MTNRNQARRFWCNAALSTGLLLTAVPAALAQPADPGLNPPNPCDAQCADDARATQWNLDNISAR